jgi:hypothetical protein
MVLLIITYLIPTTPMYIISEDMTGDTKIPYMINGSTLTFVNLYGVAYTGYFHTIKYTIIISVSQRVSSEEKQ